MKCLYNACHFETDFYEPELWYGACLAHRPVQVRFSSLAENET